MTHGLPIYSRTHPRHPRDRYHRLNIAPTQYGHNSIRAAQPACEYELTAPHLLVGAVMIRHLAVEVRTSALTLFVGSCCVGGSGVCGEYLADRSRAPEGLTVRKHGRHQQTKIINKFKKEARTDLSAASTVGGSTSRILPAWHGRRRPRPTLLSSPATRLGPVAVGLQTTPNLRPKHWPRFSLRS